MKPSIPKGTRDFSPTEVANRTYIMNTIKTAFENFGFQPIETPSFENSSTLMGKYGEEGDRLIFKILNSGDYLKDVRNRLTYSADFSNVFYKVFDSIENLENKEDETEYSNYIENIFNVFEYTSKKDKENLKTCFHNNREGILNYYKEQISSEERLRERFKFKDGLFVDVFNKHINSLDSLDSKKATPLVSEKALRYDLTVPFARFVVQHQNGITFPFKRYQIQPVWRADRPQKGRFREFFQCDADVVGSKSLWQEVEFVQLYDAVFTKLGLAGTTIKLNNRKILSGIAEVIGASDKLIDFTVALDKLDKIGKDGVVKEMLAKGISEEAIKKIDPLFQNTGTNIEKLTLLEYMLKDSEEGLKGVEELRFMVNSITELGLQSATLEIDVTLARGLNYYTGAIYEVAAPKGVKMGSIGGGGRYDDLTSVFGVKEPLSGVGISFGLDRIYLVLEELGLFKTVELPKPKVIFLNFDASTDIAKMKAIKTLRENNIKCELYPDLAVSNKAEKRQWKYVTNRQIEFVVSKVENNVFTLKNTNTREQFNCSLSELIEKTK